MRGVLPPFRTTAEKNILRRRRVREFSHSLDPERTSARFSLVNLAVRQPQFTILNVKQVSPRFQMASVGECAGTRAQD